MNIILRQGRSQKKLMTEAMSMEELWLRESVHGWVLFLGIKSVYSDKSERNYRGKCLGWPVTSYGGVRHDENDKLAVDVLLLNDCKLTIYLSFNRWWIDKNEAHNKIEKTKPVLFP